MYADRHARQFHPASLSVAVGVNIVLIGALLFANPPSVFKKPPDRPLDTVNIPIDPPPPPETLPPEAQPRDSVEPQPAPRPIPDLTILPVDVAPVGPVFPPPPPLPPVEGGVIGGTGTVRTVDPPKPASIFTGPQVDPRYAGQFQPPYPSAEQRMGEAGRVEMRVLVGTDGRVRQAECVTATSDGFCRATRDRALAKWRFKPAMRDGVAEEAWRTMSVTFVLED